MTTLVAPERSGLITRTADLILEPLVRKSGKPKLRGYAAVFNSPSENLGFREILLPGCFKAAMSRSDFDPLLYFGHDSNKPLARKSAGNLRVWEDSKGLGFEAELPDTSLARDAMELVRSGIVRQMSFGFVPDPQAEKWSREGGEDWVRVSSVEQLVECSLVTFPAYTQTGVEEARSSSALEAIRRRRAEIRVQERDAYGPDSEHSWFRDLATVAEASRYTEGLIRSGVVRVAPGSLVDNSMPDRVHGGLDEARARLLTVSSRDIGTGALSGFADTATGVPTFIAATFQTAARASGSLAAALPHEELPPGFIVPASFVAAATITTGSTADVQATETSAVSNTDPAATTTALKPATIAGRFTVSRQLLDRSIGVDMLLARELGAAIGSSRDTEVANGSGAAGRLLGLLNTASIVAVTYVDGTPTQAELWPVLMQLRSKVATQGGEPPTLLAVHPRRRSWLMAALDTANAWAELDPPFEIVESPAIPVTLGGGTEDAILMLAPRGAMLLDRPARFELDEESPSGKLAVQFVSWQFASLVSPQPKQIGVITGTGLAAPAGY